MTHSVRHDFCTCFACMTYWVHQENKGNSQSPSTTNAKAISTSGHWKASGKLVTISHQSLSPTSQLAFGQFLAVNHLVFSLTAREIIWKVWNIMAKMRSFYSKHEEGIMQSICGVENSFSGQFLLRQNTEDKVIVASLLKLCDVQNFIFSIEYEG